MILLLTLNACSGPPADAPPETPDEAAATAALLQINTAQASFIRRTRRYAQTLDELVAEKLLAEIPKPTGYQLRLRPSPDVSSYTLTATPSTSSGRHFFTDQTGALRAESGKPATAESPAL
jgi:hypothetical protein